MTGTGAAPRSSTRPGRERLAPGSAVVIGLLMGSTFVVLLNEMLLGVALPTLVEELQVTPATGQWVTTGYLLTLAVLIPATGFVMRRFSLRTVFLGAMSLFVVGTAMAAVAPSFAPLLAGRIVQAVGTAVFIPLLMTTTIRLVPVSRRGQMLALATAVPATAPAVGPAVSGLVLSQLEWRWLFVLMLPLGVLALVLGATKLKNITTPEPARLDVASLALSAVGFGGLVYGLASIGESVSGEAHVSPVVPIVVGLLGVTAFVLRQLALAPRGDALLDLRIFRTRSYTLSLLVMVFIAGIGAATVVVLPLVLSSVLGLGTLAIGLFMVPGGAAIALMSAVGGRVYDRVGPRPFAVPGALIWVTSLWILSTVDATTSVWVVLVAYVVLSGSQAMMWAPMTTTALVVLRAELYPHGSAAFTTVQQLAGAAGTAVLVSAYTIGARITEAGELSGPQAIDASQAAFTTAGVLGLGALIGTLLVGKPRPPVPDDDPGAGAAAGAAAAGEVQAPQTVVP